MAETELLVRGIRDDAAAAAAREVQCSSRAAPWRDLVRLERARRPALGEAEIIMIWPTVSVIRRDSGVLEQRVNGDAPRALALTTGAVLTYPEGLPVHVRLAQPVDFTCLQIAPALLAEVAKELGGPAELASTWRAADEQIERMVALFEAELRAGCPGGRPYGEHLARALAVYLARCYRGPGRPQRRDKIAAALEYIEAHAMQELSIPRVAKAVHLSPYHFSRLFKQSTGLSPHQYVLHCRIEEAKRLLRTTDVDLAELAQRLGFRDQSHFTARFRKATGATPRRWRQKSVSLA